jgi:hypothetical protein
MWRFIVNSGNLIEVKLIPHEQERYSSWADWTFHPDGSITIYVSNESKLASIKDRRYLFLAAIHELVEAFVLSHQLGSDQKAQVECDDFDFDYEARRMEGQIHAACGCEITDDPGADKHAPYKSAHHAAEVVEYGLARLLGVDPKEYDAAFIALDGGVAGNRK